MILYSKGESPEKRHVASALMGRRINSFELNSTDVRALLELPPDQLHNWLNTMMCRFLPGP